MRKYVNRFVVLLVVCALSSIMALAAGKSRSVTFLTDVMLNGTVIKKGTYQVAFDEKTGELTISNRKKVIAKGNARLEKFNGTPGTVYVTGSKNELASIVFSNNQATLGGGGGSSTSAQ
jgi:predicted outer membrane repeat protein